ncbi:Fe-S cluster assembly protein SufD [candidate division KSB1 bacterium]|nr:Fe-S cluster assembly protein SufD [candidate division KSB1 bacterium]
MNHMIPNWVEERFLALQNDSSSLASGPRGAERKQAIETVRRQGFPDRRQEAWRFFDLQELQRQTFTAAPAVTVDDAVRRTVQRETLDDRWPTAVLLNGRFSPELSRLQHMPAGLMLDRFSENPPATLGKLVPHSASTFAALNSALYREGVAVTVKAGEAIEEPIQILHLIDTRFGQVVIHPRVWMNFEHHSQASVVEIVASIEGEYSTFTNPLSEIFVDREAVVDHIRLLRHDDRAFHVSAQYSHQAANSHLTSLSLVLGGGWVRNDVHALSEQEGATTVLDGLYIAGGRQSIDHHTFMDHAGANSNSRQLYKGILDERAHAVFNGKIFVRRPAQKTDAVQNNKNLLLSDDASVDSQPMLEIFADDVRCTHGGTVGRLDLAGIHYLRSRGIGLETAKKLMIHSFAGDVLRRVRRQDIRDSLDERVMQKLESLPSIGRGGSL